MSLDFRFTLLLLVCLPVHALQAESNNSRYMSIQGGEERREVLNWIGITIGKSFESLPGSEYLPGWLHSVLIRTQWQPSIDLSIARIDKTFFEKARYDISLVPRFTRFVSERVYVNLGIGIAYTDVVSENREGKELALGGVFFFAPEANLGYQFGQRHPNGFVEFSYRHRSNGNIRTDNQSENFFLLSVGTRFCLD